MEQAVVFGCGKTAHDYREEIHKRFEVIAYTCNRPEKWGQEMDGVPIIDPAQIPDGVTVLVASEAYYPEIIYGLEQDKRQQDRRYFVLIQGDFIQFFPDHEDTGGLLFEYPKVNVCPTQLELGFSGLCNSKCQYCPFHSRYSTYKHPRELMTENTVNEIVRQVKPIRSFKTLVLVVEGEPMFHPKWQEYAIRVLNASGSIEECVVYTNGMLLTQENAKKLKELPVQKLRLVVSVDGSSPEDCEYWRQGEKFSVIRDHINKAYNILCQRSEETEILISGCVVLPKNFDVHSACSVEDFLQRSSKWVREEFPFAKCTYQLAQPMVPGLPGVKTIEVPRSPRLQVCTNPFFLTAISANGDILSCPCGYSLRSENERRIGNIHENDLLEVFYQNKTLNELRNTLLDNKRPKLCGECSQLGGSKISCLQRTE